MNSSALICSAFCVRLKCPPCKAAIFRTCVQSQHMWTHKTHILRKWELSFAHPLPTVLCSSYYTLSRLTPHFSKWNLLFKFFHFLKFLFRNNWNRLLVSDVFVRNHSRGLVKTHDIRHLLSQPKNSKLKGFLHARFCQVFGQFEIWTEYGLARMGFQFSSRTIPHMQRSHPENSAS